MARESEKVTYLYVISDPSGPFKIGISDAMNGRLSSLQTGNPRKLKIEYLWEVGSRSYAVKLERFIHDNLVKHSLVGEWYCFDFDISEIAAPIEELVKASFLPAPEGESSPSIEVLPPIEEACPRCQEFRRRNAASVAKFRNKVRKEREFWS